MQHINEDIRSGNFSHLYLLYGEEAYLRKQYRDKLKSALIGEDTMNFYYHEGKDVSVPEIIDLSETMPFFADRRLILLENSGLFKSGGEELADYLKEFPEATYFVFVEQEIDKRSKLYKAAQAAGYVSEFTVQDETTLKRWIMSLLKKEGKTLSGRTLEYFLEMTGTDMENIQKELEKLFCYCMNKDVIEIQDVDAICTRQLTNRIFDMVGAIAEKKQEKAMSLYYELLELKEAPMRILFLVARQFNLLMQVKELQKKGYSSKQISSMVGLPGFVINKYMTQARGFSEERLREAVEASVQAEEDVKTGRMSDSMSLELLIITYSR